MCAPARRIAAALPAIWSSRRSPKLPASAPASRVLPITGWWPMPPRDAVLEAPLRHVYKALPHDSGAKHVQGSAEYIDDMPEPVGTMHIAVGGSPVARGTIRRIDLAEVRARLASSPSLPRRTYRERTIFRRGTPTSRCSH